MTDPINRVYFPNSQIEHTLDEAEFAYVPTAHGVHVVDPIPPE